VGNDENGGGRAHTDPLDATPRTSFPQCIRYWLHTSLEAAVTLTLFAVIYWLAFAVRFGFDASSQWMHGLWMTVPWVLSVKYAVFRATGHGWNWPLYVTFADLVALLRAALLSLALILAIGHLLVPYQVPLAVPILDCVLTVMLYGVVKASGRIFVEHVWPAVHPKACVPALLIGGDRSTGLLAHQINCHAELRYRIRGFLVTGRGKTGQRLAQIPILGHLDNMREIATRHRIRDILVIAGTLSGQHMRWVMDTCEEAGLTLKIIPPVEDLFSGNRWIPLRDLDISDLLPRSPVELDNDAIGELIEGRSILVTGAGGSIGSEICRQVLRFKPAELVLLGRGENRIFFIEQELRAQGASTTLSPVIADITDTDRMQRVFERYPPDVVLHAAAHKHVPLMEANIGEAIKNNFLGTKCVADLAGEFRVKNMVLISSDKAVNPPSVMGATKHLAERYLQAMSDKSATRFAVVRFGNVLGSAGSVVPIFQNQIRRGGPITVTAPRMTRYFMTIPEAAQLVLQASAMGRGGEIFVLDMGEPVRIVDLARDLVRLSGLPANAIDITYTGIRPGEKLEEQLYFDDEQTLPTTHPKVRLAKHRYSGIDGMPQLVAKFENAIGQSEEYLRFRLCEAVPEYLPPRDMLDKAEQIAVSAVPIEAYSQTATGEGAAL